MKNLNSKKNKHMDLSDRTEIQMGLERGNTMREIASIIGKDPTTVSKEIRKHLIVKEADIKVSCKDKAGNEKEAARCPFLVRSPYVCNGCQKKRHKCAYPKQFYYARNAQRKYEETLVDSRTGIPLAKESFYELDKMLTEGIKKGQRLYHLSQTKELGVSQATVYRYLHRGYLSVNKFDFPRVVKFKERKKYQRNYIPKESKKGRTYDDFKAFIQDNNIASWVEMDTVIGRIGGKVIMTFNFSFCNFIFGVLLEDKTALEVSNKVNILKTRFKANDVRFGDIIALLLTDNGGEFANIWSFINDLEGNHETDLFFCDPHQSSQKARIEKSHTLFRDIVPKGESFDDFNQETVNLIFSHVNSVKRKGLNGKSAYEMFCFTYGEKIAEILGIKSIPSDEVIQSPKLLK
jgi:transposase, IS30 family